MLLSLGLDYFLRDPTILGFFIRGFIWDIPILIFAYVVFWGPIFLASRTFLKFLASFLGPESREGIGGR